LVPDGNGGSNCPKISASDHGRRCTSEGWLSGGRRQGYGYEFVSESFEEEATVLRQRTTSNSTWTDIKSASPRASPHIFHGRSSISNPEARERGEQLEDHRDVRVNSSLPAISLVIPKNARQSLNNRNILLTS